MYENCMLILGLEGVKSATGLSRPRTSNVIDLDEKTLPDNSHFMKRVDLRQLIVMAS